MIYKIQLPDKKRVIYRRKTLKGLRKRLEYLALETVYPSCVVKVGDSVHKVVFERGYDTWSWNAEPGFPTEKGLLIQVGGQW